MYIIMIVLCFVLCPHKIYFMCKGPGIILYVSPLCDLCLPCIYTQFPLVNEPMWWDCVAPVTWYRYVVGTCAVSEPKAPWFWPPIRTGISQQPVVSLWPAYTPFHMLCSMPSPWKRRKTDVGRFDPFYHYIFFMNHPDGYPCYTA